MIKYIGKNGSAKEFVNEMFSLGIVDSIRKEEGNIRYEYLFPMDDDESIVLIDSWKDQEALDKHHHLPLMKTISALREKYDLHMEAEKYSPIEDEKDKEYIRK